MNSGSFLADMISYLIPFNGKCLLFENLTVTWGPEMGFCTIDFSQVSRRGDMFNRLAVDHIIDYLKKINYEVKFVSYLGQCIGACAPRRLFNLSLLS